MTNPVHNPFGAFKQECQSVLHAALEECSLHLITNYRFTRPSNPEFGELASSLCFELAKQLERKPSVLAEQLVARVSLTGKQLIERVEAKHGYVNFHTKYPILSRLTITTTQNLDSAYGYVQTDSPQKIIVEHTSVNPSGPIHIGTARNSILGDAIYRMLLARGHHVSANFYVNDVGKQIAVLVYGYEISKNTPVKDKIDHWVGRVYAITSCLIEIKVLTKQLSVLRAALNQSGEIQRTYRALSDWASALEELKKQEPELVKEISHHLDYTTNHDQQISQLLQLYEEADTQTTKTVRSVVELCLQGFRQTYDRMDIHWDSWDWESTLVWSGAVAQVIQKLRKTPYCTEIDGALIFNVNKAAEEFNLKNLLDIPEEHEIPSLTLTRSDGTSLYPTRDIAYSIWKVNRVNQVINVIGKEQALAQTQIKIAVSLLASLEKALSQTHYAYELVQIIGYKMSKRRGRYITLDEILDEAEIRALEEVEKKSPHLPLDRKAHIAKIVAKGAVKYALISFAPSKPVMFSWDRALNFEMNSAPFIQYAYARATNILKKAVDFPTQPIKYALLTKINEQELVRKVALFPEVFLEAVKGLTAHTIAEYANDLAASFNSYYASTPVLQASTLDLRDARLALVQSVRITIRNALALLGIDVLERM